MVACATEKHSQVPAIRIESELGSLEWRYHEDYLVALPHTPHGAEPKMPFLVCLPGESTKTLQQYGRYRRDGGPQRLSWNVCVSRSTC